jgi:plastocyanin
VSIERLVVTLCVAGACLGCEAPDPELIPDAYLQAELGLTPEDRVHTVALSTEAAETADPDSLTLAVGDFVQFVSEDWLVHEIAFDLDQVTSSARTFLEGTGQTASPPLIDRGGRFVLSFSDAPPGRYPYALQGNRGPGHGVLVVVDPDAR